VVRRVLLVVVGLVLTIASLPLSYTSRSIKHIWGNSANQRVLSVLADNGLFNLKNTFGKVEAVTANIMGFDGLVIFDPRKDVPEGAPMDPSADVTQTGLAIASVPEGIKVDVAHSDLQGVTDLFAKPVDIPPDYPINLQAVRMAKTKTMRWNADWANAAHSSALYWRYLYVLGYGEYRLLGTAMDVRVPNMIFAWYLVPLLGAVLIAAGLWPAPKRRKTQAGHVGKRR
jgi:hypothetical protein